MKNIMVFVVVITFVIIGTLAAQDLGYGAKAGLNFGTYVGEDVEDVGFRTGLSVGGFATLPISDKFTVRPEILFTQNGVREEEDAFGADIVYKHKLNWLDIPILGVFNVQPNIRVFAGPFIDIFLSGEWTAKGKEEGVNLEFDEKIERDEIKSLAVGIVLGGAYGVTDNIDVELRYTRGLNSLDKEPKDWDETFGGKYEKMDYKTSMIQILCNYYLKK